MRGEQGGRKGTEHGGQREWRVEKGRGKKRNQEEQKKIEEAMVMGEHYIKRES